MTWLNAGLHQDVHNTREIATINKLLEIFVKKEERRQSFAISAVFVFVFVGFHEPCATLALWLGSMHHFLLDVNSAPDRSVIKSKTRWGIVIYEAAPHQLDSTYRFLE